MSEKIRYECFALALHFHSDFFPTAELLAVVRYRTMKRKTLYSACCKGFSASLVALMPELSNPDLGDFTVIDSKI
jgi:hypothetical protein